MHIAALKLLFSWTRLSKIELTYCFLCKKIYSILSRGFPDDFPGKDMKVVLSDRPEVFQKLVIIVSVFKENPFLGSFLTALPLSLCLKFDPIQAA